MGVRTEFCASLPLRKNWSSTASIESCCATWARPTTALRTVIPFSGDSASRDRWCRDRRRIADQYTIGSRPLPLLESQTIGFEQGSDLPNTPTKKLIQNGHEDAECVVAQDGAFRDTSELLILGNGDGESVPVVDVQHDVHVGTAVTHVNHAVRSDTEAVPQVIEDRNLAVTCRDTIDRPHFTRPWIEVKLGSKDVVRGQDAVERRNNDFFRRGGNHEEGKAVARQAPLQKIDQRRDLAFEPDPPSRLDQVLAAHAAKLRVVANEVGKFSALLNEIAARKTVDLLLKAADSKQLAQHEARVIEAQRLIEIRGQQIVFGKR